jgi:hypothetical protein
MMENRKDEMLEVTIYKSTVTPYMSKYDMDFNDPFFDTPDNMMEVEFPRSIVEAWYNQCREFFDGEDFDDWLRNEYTADDTDGLYDFAVERGFTPDIPKPRKFEVQLTATYEVWAFDKDSAVEVAERKHNIGDYWIYVDGKSYS